MSKIEFLGKQCLRYCLYYGFGSKKRIASGHECPRFQPFFDALTHCSVKSSVFNIFLRFFFSSESWDVVFFKNEKEGSKGGSPDALFWLETSLIFLKIFGFITFTLCKISHPLAPLFQIWKIQHLSFHWKKKINVVACLVQILEQFHFSIP